MSAVSCDGTHACDAGNTRTDEAGNVLCHAVDKTCVCTAGHENYEDAAACTPIRNFLEFGGISGMNWGNKKCAAEEFAAVKATLTNAEQAVPMASIKSVICETNACDLWSGSYGDVLPTTGVAFWDVTISLQTAHSSTCSSFAPYVFGIMLDSDVSAWKVNCVHANCDNKQRLNKIKYGYASNSYCVVDGAIAEPNLGLTHISNNVVTHMKYDADAATLSVASGGYSIARPALSSAYKVIRTGIPAGSYRAMSLGQNKRFIMRNHYNVVASTDHCDGTFPCVAANTLSDASSGLPLCRKMDKKCECKDGFSGNDCGSS